MAHCPACGTALPDGARFCPVCGKRLEGGRRWGRVRAGVLAVALIVGVVAVVILLQRDQKHPVPAVAATTTVLATATAIPTATPSGLVAASGSGGGSTRSFTVSSPGWTTSYTWDCTRGQTTSNEEFVFGVALSDASTGKTVAYVTVPGQTKGHSTHVWSNVGTFQLNILTEPGCTWSINVPGP